MKFVDNSVTNKKIAEYGDLIITASGDHFLLVVNDDCGEAYLINLDKHEVYDIWDENDIKRWAFVGGAINGEHEISKIINSRDIELHYK